MSKPLPLKIDAAAMERIYARFREQGIEPETLTSLSLVTWDEIIRTVLTAADEAGVVKVEWPEGDE